VDLRIFLLSPLKEIEEFIRDGSGRDEAHSGSRRGSAMFLTHYSAMLKEACSLPVHYVTLANGIWRKFTEEDLAAERWMHMEWHTGGELYPYSMESITYNYFTGEFKIEAVGLLEELFYNIKKSKKAPGELSQVLNFSVVAGVGFEPTTFGL
jgi:hypothetical protein